MPETFKTFDSAACRKLASLLEEFGEQHGLTIEIGHMRYDSRSVQFKTTAIVGTELAIDETPDGKAFKANAKWMGLEPDWLGKTFRDSSGDIYMVKGLRPTARTYPVVVERMRDRKGYRFPADRVARAMRVAA